MTASVSDPSPAQSPYSGAATSDASGIAPRPRPGFKSRAPVSNSDKAALVATTLRALLGVLCLGVAVLYMPSHMVTPILSGVSVLMIVSGSMGAWQVGRRDERVLPYARMVYWACPALGLLVFVAMLVFGAGFLGPSWNEVIGAQEPATYLAPEDVPANTRR